MTALEEALRERGFDDSEITDIVEVFEQHQAGANDGIAPAAEFLRLVFLRVEKDSPVGCALRRALGLSGGASFRRAAADFCVTKQHLHALQTELEAKLGTLRLGNAAIDVSEDEVQG